MKNIIILLIIYFFMSCGNEKNPTIITVGKTHKIISEKEWQSEFEISYLWSKPKGPENHKSTWVINEESVLFTPGILGEYTLSLSIETTTGQILGNEKFHLLAINNTEKEQIIKEQIKKLETEKPKVIQNNYGKGFSVQVSSWDIKNDALKQKIKLTELGFDNIYVKRKKNKTDNSIVWRVRIGPYISIRKAKKISEKLNALGYNNYISEVSYKN